MKTPNILIVEDATQVEIDLKNRLIELGFKVESIVSNPILAADILAEGNTDLVLMDLFLSETYTGIDATKDIVKRFDIPVLFLAGEEKVKLSQLENSAAFALLLKPISDIELAFNINAALAFQPDTSINPPTENKSKSYIFVRADYRLNKIRVNEIYYLEAKKDYVTIHTTDNVYTVHATMRDMESILPSDLFIRTHRSYIVNLDKIFSIKYPDILIEHKMKTIPIGGLYRKALFNRINVI
jgi:DNA-binding LytR/AlgR family response regulator